MFSFRREEVFLMCPETVIVFRKVDVNYLMTSLLILHVLQVDFQGLDRNLDFPDGKSQRGDEQQDGEAEHVHRQGMQPDVDQKHGNDTEEQAGDAQYLHVACQVEPFPQVGYLCGGHLGMLFHVLFLQGTYQLGIRKETVGIGQQNQRDG